MKTLFLFFVLLALAVIGGIIYVQYIYLPQMAAGHSTSSQTAVTPTTQTSQTSPTPAGPSPATGQSKATTQAGTAASNTGNANSVSVNETPSLNFGCNDVISDSQFESILHDSLARD